jgi:RNA polymerase sigma-70 factor (ECF subfamily)
MAIQVLEPAVPAGVSEYAPDEADGVLALRGDSESFMRLYQRYVRPVYRYLYARIGHHHDAEETTAIAFERAWHSLPRYRPSGPFAGWLFTIVRRALADHYRRSGARPPSVAIPADAGADERHQPEAALLRDEQRLLLRQAIARLGPEQQEVVCLRFFADLPYAAIAALLGKKEAAVKMMAYRSLESLKRSIDHDETQP